jgi:hypothetical protein
VARRALWMPESGLMDAAAVFLGGGTQLVLELGRQP